MTFNPLSKLTHSYYKITKEVVEEHRSSGHRFLYLLDLTLYLYSFRLFFISYVILVDFDTRYNYRRYDLVINFLRNNPAFMDPYFPMVIFLFATFYVYCQRALYNLNVNTLTWRWWYQLVVLNQDAYWEAMLPEDQVRATVKQRETDLRRRLTREHAAISFLLPDFVAKILCNLLARFLVWMSLENVNRKSLFSRPLSILPNLSDRLRSRLLLCLTVADRFALAMQLLFVFIFIFFFIFQGYYYQVINGHGSEHPWYILLWFAGEVFFTFYVMMRLLHCALFFTLCSIFGTIVYTGHVIDVGSTVKRMINQFKGGPGSFIPFRFRALLELQMREHGKVCYLVLCGSDELFGKVLFAFLMTNMPINIYFIRRMVFMENTVYNLVMMYCASTVQLMAGIVVFAPLAWCCKIYHSPREFIPKLQPLLIGYQWLIFKLKYDDLYGRLIDHGPKMAVSMGPAGAITYLSALEFLFLYIAYILMSFAQILTANISNKWDMGEF